MAEMLQKLKTLVDGLILGDSKVTHPAPSRSAGVSASVSPSEVDGGRGAPPPIESGGHIEIATGHWKVEQDRPVPPPTFQLHRTRTILLLEGINNDTERPIRCYIRPDDTLVYVETVGQLVYTVDSNRAERGPR